MFVHKKKKKKKKKKKMPKLERGITQTKLNRYQNKHDLKSVKLLRYVHKG